MSTEIQVYCRRPSLGEMDALIEMGVHCLAWHIRPEDGMAIIEAERMARRIKDAGRKSTLLVHSRKVQILSTVARMVRPDFLLLSSDRDDSEMGHLAALVAPNTKLMMSVPVSAAGLNEKVDSYRFAIEYQAFAGALTVDTMLDTKSPSRFGCTGRTNDWDTCAEIVKASSVPVVLAGGLRAENVGEAIRRVRPPIVDACTSLEFPDKSKDLAKCRTFVDAVRAVDVAISQVP